MERAVTFVTLRAADALRLIRWWSAAERRYLSAITLDPRTASLHFRLSQVRERRGDCPGAEQALRKAIEVNRTVALYHYRLGRLVESQGRLAGAAEAYAEAIALDPRHKEWYARAAHAYERKPAVAAAIDVYEQALSRFGDDLTLRRRLAGAYEDAGNWSKACGIWRDMLTASPDDVTANYRLAVCLEKLARVPFELRGDQLLLASSSDHESDLGVDQAIEHFQRALTRQPRRVTRFHRVAARLARSKRLFQLASRQLGMATRVHQQFAQPETRLRRLYELGRMYERHGRLEDAVKTYRAAVDGLQRVDSIWVHRAEPAWRFRLIYAEEQLRPTQEPDPRLRRAVTPADDHETGIASGQEVGGFFEALITDWGLHIEGFLVPSFAEGVDVIVDGDLVKRVAANAQVWLRTFHFEISHAVLAEFPASARLTVYANGRPLVSRRGHHALDVRVPDGTGHLAKLLSTGYGVSKKGMLTRPSSEAVDRDERYLSAYCELKHRFEDLTGKQLFLIYGTLLGCYRDGAFIAGDDDFDVSYLSDATDPVDLKREARQMALTLLQAGFDVCMTVTGRLFKVRFNDVWLDVNPVWFYRGRAWSFDSHRLVRGDFEPVKTMPFLGHDVYVPNHVEAFLADNYGSNWRTPQPDFRYYRNEADRRILRRSWLTPREAREFARLAEAERRPNPSAGQFLGIGDPADPRFS